MANVSPPGIGVGGIGVTDPPSAATPVASYNPSPPDDTYVAKAVHFDGLTYLLNEAVKATDTAYLNASFWMKVTFNEPNPAATAFATYDTIPLDYRSSFFTANFGGITEGLSFSALVSDFTLIHSWEADGDDAFPFSTWNHFLFASDSSVSPPVYKLYVNGTASPVTLQIPGVLPFDVLLNGLAMLIGTDLLDDGFTLVGDFADFWLGNQNLLVAGDIPLATRRLFISPDGRPVTPDHFPSALVLLTGNKDTFPINRGSGGSFAVTGALTNATTSPSDVTPHYIAPAVHFDGATTLLNAAMTATDTNYYNFSVWIKFPASAAVPFPQLFTMTAPGGLPLLSNVYIQMDVGAFAINAFAAPATGYVNGAYNVDNLGNPTLDTWAHLLIAFDVSGASPIVKIYVNGIDSGVSAGGASPFLVTVNGDQCLVGDDGFGDLFEGDMANFWFSNQNLLVNGDIPEATRRLFISADIKPVNPVEAIDVLGLPLILLSGDATNFHINRGTVGAFATTGALTNASTSPSD